MLVFKVRTRFHKPVGEKIQRVKKSIELSGIIIYTLESQPYGLTVGDVEKDTETHLEALRSALSLSGVHSKVVRESV